MLQSPLLAKGYRKKSLLSLPCALCVSGPLRDYSCKIFSSRFPAHASVKHLLILLLLSSDIALNQGPINFALVNCHSIRSKSPWIGDTIVSNNLDILVLAETHFPNSDTDSLLMSFNSARFQLTHRPRKTGHGCGVGFLTSKTYRLRLLIHQQIPLSKTLSYQLLVIQCHLLWLVSIASQVHVPLLFLMISCFSLVFLSSLTSSFIICGDFNVHVDTDCIDQRKFFILLDTSNLAQNVNKCTHFHGQILDLILSVSDSSFTRNLTVGELVSGHALVKCHLDLSKPLKLGQPTLNCEV